MFDSWEILNFIFLHWRKRNGNGLLTIGMGTGIMGLKKGESEKKKKKNRVKFSGLTCSLEKKDNFK